MYTPIYFGARHLLKKQTFSTATVRTALPTFINRGTLVGLGLTAALYFGYTRNFTQNNFDDRAFRLAHNKMNKFWDDVWLGSTAVGSLVGAMYGKVWIGGLYGHALGTLGFIVLNQFRNK